jgi:UDP-N-acetylglucosamine 1-carboxyvinyltransferase
VEKIVIKEGGRRRINGSLNVSGAKNSALPILAACILTEESVLLRHVPHLLDVTTMINILMTMGAHITVDEQYGIEINSRDINRYHAPYALVRTMRASFMVLGPLLSRFGEAEVALPGGCAIGSRPVDFHLQALEKMGASFVMEGGYVKGKVKGKSLVGADIHFPISSVGSTENIMMAAVLAKGRTRIFNAAKEPEVIDLANFLKHLGANISGEGTDCICIEGVSSLKGGEYRVISDRLEAGTFLLAAVVTGGEIMLTDVDPKMLTSVIAHLRKASAEVLYGSNWIRLKMDRSCPKPVDIHTAAYPGFPTDLQAQWVVLNALADGDSVVCEQLFENRFMHVQELQRMNADLQVRQNKVMIRGRKQLLGAPVVATDIRASASLVLAGLAAVGETVISEVHLIDRGYEAIEAKLMQLGVENVHRERSYKIQRETENC